MSKGLFVIAIEDLEECPQCKGSGGFELRFPPDKIKRGKRLREIAQRDGYVAVGPLPCGMCKGTGAIYRDGDQIRSLPVD